MKILLAIALVILSIIGIIFTSDAFAEIHIVTTSAIISTDSKGIKTDLSTKMIHTVNTIDPVTKLITKTVTKPAEYHLTVSDKYDTTKPDVVYAAKWDQVSPCIDLIKGDISSLSLGFLGWPMISCVDWNAQNPKVK